MRRGGKGSASGAFGTTGFAGLRLRREVRRPLRCFCFALCAKRKGRVVRQRLRDSPPYAQSASRGGEKGRSGPPCRREQSRAGPLCGPQGKDWVWPWVLPRLRRPHLCPLAFLTPRKTTSEAEVALRSRPVPPNEGRSFAAGGTGGRVVPAECAQTCLTSAEVSELTSLFLCACPFL